MGEIKVSIIVPVYNTENYLKQCLLSLIQQSLAEIEIIVVNDGSTDNSANIINDFVEKDDRIKYFEKSNEGQGIARNIAINFAVGEYIAFVDSDDWVDENMFYLLYESAKKNDADIVVCDYQIYDSEKNLSYQLPWNKIPQNLFNDSKTLIWPQFSESMFEFNSAPWNKIYKRSLIKCNGISFTPGANFQDIFFNFYSIINANCINYVDSLLYNYRFLRLGATTTDRGLRQFDIFTVLNQLQIVLEDNERYDSIKYSFFNYKFSQYLYHYREIETIFKSVFAREILTEYYTLDKDLQNYLVCVNADLQTIINMGFAYFNYLKGYPQYTIRTFQKIFSNINNQQIELGMNNSTEISLSKLIIDTQKEYNVFFDLNANENFSDNIAFKFEVLQLLDYQRQKLIEKRKLIAEYTAIITEIHKSYSYRIGKFILKPVVAVLTLSKIVAKSIKRNKK